MSIILFFSFLLNHPLFLRINLLFLSLIVIINIIDRNYRRWFTILLCLIYLGGILILFVYISSFLPNIKSNINVSFYEIIILMLTIIIVCIFFKIRLPFSFFSIKRLRIININFIFIKKIIRFIFMIIIYMIIILIFSVYLISFNKFPLREI